MAGVACAAGLSGCIPTRISNVLTLYGENSQDITKAIIDKFDAVARKYNLKRKRDKDLEIRPDLYWDAPFFLFPEKEVLALRFYPLNRVRPETDKYQCSIVFFEDSTIDQWIALALEIRDVWIENFHATSAKLQLDGRKFGKCAHAPKYYCDFAFNFPFDGQSLKKALNNNRSA